MTSPRAPAPLGIFTSGPWQSEDGDPGHPDSVYGVRVVECVGTDSDGRHALVRLVDGRYALTGEAAVIGPPRKLAHYLRRRCRDLTGENWFQQAGEFLRREASRRRAPGVRDEHA